MGAKRYVVTLNDNGTVSSVEELVESGHRNVEESGDYIDSLNGGRLWMLAEDNAEAEIDAEYHNVHLVEFWN